MNFDRGANNALLHRPQDACGVVAPGTRRSQVRKFYLITKKKHPPYGECFFLVAGTGLEPATSGL